MCASSKKVTSQHFCKAQCWALSMLRILWLGNLTKVVVLFLVYAKLITLRRRGSLMLRLGLSFWKQIPDKWLRWFHGSLTHPILSLPGGRDTKPWFHECLPFLFSTRLPVSVKSPFRCSGEHALETAEVISGPKRDPRGIPGRCLCLHGFPRFSLDLALIISSSA